MNDEVAKTLPKWKMDISTKINPVDEILANPPADWLLDSYDLPPQVALEKFLPPHVIEGCLREGEVTLLAAQQKSRKTYLLLGVVVHLAAGQDVLGMHVPKPRKIRLFDLELSSGSIQGRLCAVFNGCCRRYDWSREKAAMVASNIYVHSLRNSLSIDDKLSTIAEVASGLGPEWVVTVDSFQAVFTGDHNSVADVRKGIGRLTGATAKKGCSMIVIDHFNKDYNAQGSNRISGSAAKLGAFDNVVILERKRGGIQMTFTDIRDSLPPKPKSLEFNHDELLFSEISCEEKQREQASIFFEPLRMLLPREFTQKDIERESKTKSGLARKMLEMALGEKIIVKLKNEFGEDKKVVRALLYGFSASDGQMLSNNGANESLE